MACDDQGRDDRTSEKEHTGGSGGTLATDHRGAATHRGKALCDKEGWTETRVGDGKTCGSVQGGMEGGR